MKLKKFNILLAMILALSLSACSNTGGKTVENEDKNIASDLEITKENENEKSVENEDNKTENKEETPENNSESEAEETETEETTEENKEKTTGDEETEETTEENKEKTTEDEKEKIEEDVEKEENTKNTDQNSDLEERDGNYTSNLVAANNGNRGKQSNQPYISNISLKDDTLIIEGTIDYYVEPKNRDNVEKYENNAYNFKISPDVTFQAVGGNAEPKIFTKEGFVEYYNKVKDSGLGLSLDVENGLLINASIFS